jgi:AcrR family transcriptional regulator
VPTLLATGADLRRVDGDVLDDAGRAERLAPAQRRRQLFDAVGRLIKREGLARVTMVAVAAEAGVSRRLAYACVTDLSTLLRDLAIDTW